MSEVASALRLAHAPALAALVRRFGDLDQAEDALQAAVSRALERWPTAGVPDVPAAWLVRTAGNLVIDDYRRQQLHRRYLADAPRPEHQACEDEAVGLRDDMLRLLFVCCHPVLSMEARVALTLKAVAGLSVEEIAGAFLVEPRTLEQRLVRAKRRIRERGVSYAVPSAREQCERLGAVLAVLHLVFNEGYSASSDAPLIRRELCHLAIGQTRLLLRLFPTDAETEGLLSLFLSSVARMPARLRDGEPVPLDAQDRTRWDASQITEALALLETALRRGRPGPYQLQAAISAVHCRASQYADTDWAEIVRLYDAWLGIAPSHVVSLNRAVAVSRLQGAQAGLDALRALGQPEALTRRHAYHTVEGTLLAELGRDADAVTAFERALARTRNPTEQRYLRGRIDTLKKS